MKCKKKCALNQNLPRHPILLLWCSTPVKDSLVLPCSTLSIPRAQHYRAAAALFMQIVQRASNEYVVQVMQDTSTLQLVQPHHALQHWRRSESSLATDLVTCRCNHLLWRDQESPGSWQKQRTEQHPRSCMLPCASKGGGIILGTGVKVHSHMHQNSSQRQVGQRHQKRCSNQVLQRVWSHVLLSSPGGFAPKCRFVLAASDWSLQVGRCRQLALQVSYDVVPGHLQLLWVQLAPPHPGQSHTGHHRCRILLCGPGVLACCRTCRCLLQRQSPQLPRPRCPDHSARSVHLPRLRSLEQA